MEWLRDQANLAQLRTIFADALAKFLATREADPNPADILFLSDLRLGLDPVSGDLDPSCRNNHLAALEGYFREKGIVLQNLTATDQFGPEESNAYALYRFLKVEESAAEAAGTEPVSSELIAARKGYEALFTLDVVTPLKLGVITVPTPDGSANKGINNWLQPPKESEVSTPDNSPTLVTPVAVSAGSDLPKVVSAVGSNGPSDLSPLVDKFFAEGENMKGNYLNYLLEIYGEEKDLPALTKAVAEVLQEQFGAMNGILRDGLKELANWRSDTNKSEKGVSDRYQGGLKIAVRDELTALKHKFLVIASEKALEILGQLRAFRVLLADRKESLVADKMPPVPDFTSLRAQFAAYADPENTDFFSRILATGNGDCSRKEIIASWQDLHDLVVKALLTEEERKSAFAGYDRLLIAEQGLVPQAAKKEQKKLNRALASLQEVAERFGSNSQPFLAAWKKLITAEPQGDVGAWRPSSPLRRTAMATVATVIFGLGAEVAYQESHQSGWWKNLLEKIANLLSSEEQKRPLPPKKIIVQKPLPRPVVPAPTVPAPSTVGRQSASLPAERRLETQVTETTIVIAEGDSFLLALKKQAESALDALPEGEMKNELHQKFIKVYAAVNDEEIRILSDYLNKGDSKVNIAKVFVGQKFKVAFRNNEEKMPELLQVLVEILRARANQL